MVRSVVSMAPPRVPGPGMPPQRAHPPQHVLKRSSTKSPAAPGVSRIAVSRIIQSKITVPRIPDTVVPRQRVEIQLANLIEGHRVVCLYATAGAGKTTAAHQAASHLDRPLCWLSVDTTDVAVGRLLHYLEATLAAAVPGACGIVDAALSAGLPHGEVAGLLAESIGPVPLLLILDDLERLDGATEALTVLSTLLRYLPDTARVVLISRQELPLSGEGVAATSWLMALGDDELAFTAEEAAAALARTDRSDIDPAAAIAATGGWVTGVLFEAWRSAEHATGLGGEADPLHGYLAAQILSQLTSGERDFLIHTALLHEVTPAAAEALGETDAAARLHALRARHLPASWDCPSPMLRCHPRFREYLLACLDRRDEAERKRLRRAHADWLNENNHPEEAVDEYLAADALTEALTTAEQVLERVIERADLPVAERWLQRIQPVRREHHTALAGAELMLAIAHEDYRRGVEVSDRLAATGHRDALARSSSKLASMMAWCYFHAGRLEDIQQILAIGCPGAELDAMHYCMSLLDEVDATEPAAATLSGGPLDALIMRVHYYHGRLPLLLDSPVSPWAAKAAESWRLGALLAMGYIEQAAEAYQAICGTRDPGVWLYSLFTVELLREQGQRDAAWRALLKGRERLRAAGSVMLEMLTYVEEAALELRFNRDPASARIPLEHVRAHPVGRSYTFIAEQAATWLGLALLLAGEDQTARECLREAVASMRASGRVLLLPAAAVYLAEAEWRSGEEACADDAADAALAAADQQGSNHLLLEALGDFPVVLSRRLDAEASSESRWHDLGRALMARGVQLATPPAPALRLTEFGSVAITWDGLEVWPRLTKSYELLAFLADREHHEATKEELLDALFAGRHDDSAAAYLRQALRKLRQVLPEDAIDTRSNCIRLSDHISLTSDSARLHCLLGHASSLRGTDKLALLLEALAIVEQGTYLPGITSPWAEQHRDQLATLMLETRCQAAELAFTTGDYRRATHLAEVVLTEDPFRESVWRLQMRLADATGDPDRVIAAYRACEHALRQLDTSPSPTTQRLLNNLRK